MCRTLHYSWGHQVHFWSRDWDKLFFDRKVPISLKWFLIANIFEIVSDRHVVTIIHKYEHANYLSFGTMTFDLG